MDSLSWDQRFLPATRRRIIALLRKRPSTVDELAQALELTPNAVRSHLVTLERDDLIEQQGVRRSGGKPAGIYALTVDAERLFARAYAPVLDELLTVLVEQDGESRAKETLQIAGRRLAQPFLDDSDVRRRLEAAVEVLNNLGGLAELKIEGEHVTIQGHGCPLSATSSSHCEICLLAEALVTEIVGFPMKEHCDRGERPRCRFEGMLPADPRQARSAGNSDSDD